MKAPKSSIDLARHIFELAPVRLWLAEGILLSHAIAMLEVHRRFELSSEIAYLLRSRFCGVFATRS